MFTIDEILYAVTIFLFAFLAGVSRAMANGNYVSWKQVTAVGMFSGCLGFAVSVLMFDVTPGEGGLFPLGVAVAVGAAGHRVYVIIMEALLKRLGILPNDTPTK